MSKTIYFRNLNGLRFIAAFFVILHHTDENMIIFGHPEGFAFPKVFGPLAVRFFFALSGFLITYLLLDEKERTQTINVKSFYMRRILRIWPLYYLIVVLALFVLPHTGFFNIPPYLQTLQQGFTMKLVLLVLFIPNVLYAINPEYSIPHADQLWSIGVEEQFYLMWPWIVRRAKNYLLTFILVIFIFSALTDHLIGGILDLLVYLHLTVESSAFYQVGLVVNNFFSGWANFQIDAMAVGALAAYLVFFKKDAVLQVLFNRKFTRSLLVLFLLSVAVLHHYHVYLYFSIIFAIFILNVTLNPANRFNVEHPILKYLGRISYSIYMLHPIAITIAIKSIYAMRAHLRPVELQLIVYVVAIGISIALASFSYHLIEQPFLRMKNRFEVERKTKPEVN